MQYFYQCIIIFKKNLNYSFLICLTLTWGCSWIEIYKVGTYTQTKFDLTIQTYNIIDPKNKYNCIKYEINTNFITGIIRLIELRKDN